MPLSASFARYRLVPIPAVAVSPVTAKNSSLLFLLTSSPASVHFLTTDPLRFPWPPPQSDRSHNRFRSHRKSINRSGNVPDAAPAHEVDISERIARSGYRCPKYSMLLFSCGIPFRLSFCCSFLQFLFRIHPFLRGIFFHRCRCHPFYMLFLQTQIHNFPENSITNGDKRNKDEHPRNSHKISADGNCSKDPDGRNLRPHVDRSDSLQSAEAAEIQG